MNALPPDLAPQALLFQFAPDRRSLLLARYLTERGVQVSRVPPSDFGQTLGALLSLPGFSRVENAPAAAFREEMIVFAGFDRQLLDDFLQFIREEELRRIELKAMLTPTNASWTAARLHRELSRERTALERRRSGGR